MRQILNTNGKRTRVGPHHWSQMRCSFSMSQGSTLANRTRVGRRIFVSKFAQVKMSRLRNILTRGCLKKANKDNATRWVECAPLDGVRQTARTSLSTQVQTLCTKKKRCPKLGLGSELLSLGSSSNIKSTRKEVCQSGHK